MSSTTKKPDTKTENRETAAPLSRRKANVAARRQRILDSARTLLAEAGQGGLSMRKLAKEADLSVTTLYNLVGSREDILRAVIEDSAERFETTVGIPASSGDPLTRIVKAFDRVLGYLISDGAVLRPLVVANIATGFRKEVAEQDRDLYLRGAKDSVRECLKSAIDKGLIRDVVGLNLLEGQLYLAMELALDRWAFGLIDDDEFREKGLWGAHVTLLAFAAPESRARLEKELRKLERRFRQRGRR